MSDPVVGEEKQGSLSIPETSFDLLEGQYSKSRNSRLSVIGVLAVTAGLVLILSGQGVRGFVLVNSVQNEIAQTKDRISSLEVQLSARTDVGGLSPLSARNFVEERAETAAVVSRYNIDFGGVVSYIEQSVPAGLRVTRIEFKPASAQEGDSTGGARLLSCPTGESLSSETLGKLGEIGLDIVVTAEGPSIDDAQAWVQELRESYYLVSPTWAPVIKEGESSVTIRAGINPLLRGDKTEAYEDLATSKGITALNPCRDKRGSSASQDSREDTSSFIEDTPNPPEEEVG